MPQKPKILKIFAGLISLWLAFTLIRNIYLLWQTGGRVDEINAELEAAQKEQQRLLNQLHLIDSPQFIEKEARDKLNLTKPGEIIVILPPEEELKKIAPDLSLPQTTPQPNYLQWLNLFWEN